MGKIRKISLTKKRNVPLYQQLEEDKKVKPIKYSGKKKRHLVETIIDPGLTSKIRTSAIEQGRELEDESDFSKSNNKLNVSLNMSDSDTDVDNDLIENYIMPSYEDIENSEELNKSLELFMNPNNESRTLADVIKDKIAEKQTEINSNISDYVVDLYKDVRDILCKYRSGKLPKAFKIIPKLTYWEQILFLTEPEKWSAAAMYQATRIFTSNMKEIMAQRFFNLVLLPRIRDDIAYYKHLNFHLYEALHKALFKPGAFFKGILLPLCESCSCTLREAVIIGSVLAKHSIPVLHSSAALLRIAEMPYSGANSIFLKIFFEKHYAFPYRVIDAVVYHFLRFVGNMWIFGSHSSRLENEKRELPVLWHQALLTFIQNYKKDLSNEQAEAILNLCRIKIHHQITSEIKKELNSIIANI